MTDETPEHMTSTDDSESEPIRSFGSSVSVNRKMHEAFQRSARAAPHDATVMLLGESGTGRKAFAEEIHRRSKRSSQPLHVFDSASVPETLVESHLFGHVRGAFTDAAEERTGVFEQASGATLYITGLADLSEAVQVRFLRVVQEGRVTPIGTTTPRDVDVRLIVAAPADLEERVADGRFREDLYYRLAVIPIELPPLRERMDDLALLVQRRLRTAGLLGADEPSLSDAALQCLREHRWPGNLRELYNALDRAVVLADSSRLEASDFDWLQRRDAEEGVSTLESVLGLSVRDTHSIPVWTRAIERHLIASALEQTDQNRTKAAALLEISRRGLQYKIKEYFPEGASAPSSGVAADGGIQPVPADSGQRTTDDLS